MFSHLTRVFLIHPRWTSFTNSLCNVFLFVFFCKVPRNTSEHAPEGRIYSLRNAGTKQRQFVIMAPFTTSRLGSTINTREATPMTCNVSMPHTKMKSFIGGRLQDLKKHILRERMRVPNSGTQNAKNKHHVQATRSSAGNFTTNCLSRSAIEDVTH